MALNFTNGGPLKRNIFLNGSGCCFIDSSEPRTTVSHEPQPHTDRLLFLKNEKKKIALMPLQDGEQKIPGKTDQRTECEEAERGGGEVGQLCSSLQHT